jgi:hypothetical protein
MDGYGIPKHALMMIVAVVASFSEASAQTNESPSDDKPIDEIVFEPSASFSETNNLNEAIVDSDKLGGAGAVIVDFKLFPEIHVARISGSLCTASVVGPRTVLLAAHCVYEKRKIRVAGLSAECEISRAYDPAKAYGLTADYALCVTEEDIPNSVYGTVALEDDKIARGRYLLLSGAGCTEWNERDGKLRVGHARIVSTPNTASNDIVLDWEKVYFGGGEGAALCPGDSGGPAFYLPDVNKFQPRFIAGVNARTAAVCVPDPSIPARDCPNGDVKILGTSYVSSLATDEAQSFFQEFVDPERMGVGANSLICGFNFEDEKCMR